MHIRMLIQHLCIAIAQIFETNWPSDLVYCWFESWKRKLKYSRLLHIYAHAYSVVEIRFNQTKLHCSKNKKKIQRKKSRKQKQYQAHVVTGLHRAMGLVTSVHLCYCMIETISFCRHMNRVSVYCTCILLSDTIHSGIRTTWAIVRFVLSLSHETHAQPHRVLSKSPQH